MPDGWIKLNRDCPNCFFGYYDRNPWNHDLTLHLAVHTDLMDRLPEPGETAQVGFIERATGKFVKCAETRAWCHQQGAMQQWLPGLRDTFVYNDFDLDAGKLVAQVYKIGKGIIGCFDRPVYLLSHDGKLAVSLNFSRLVRRGYSYADVPAPAQMHPDLDQDGIFIIDIASGKSRLAISYRTLTAAHPLPYSLNDVYWWLDHPGFNSDATQLLFLFRDCASVANPINWHTNMFTMDIDGGKLRCTLPDAWWDRKITHQLWGRTPDEILLDANWRNRGSEYVVFDNRQMPLQAKLISAGMGIAGHLVFSPDKKWLLADTYPDLDRRESVAVVKVASGELQKIGSFRHQQPPGVIADLRCDLHPRWSGDGSLITVDSIDESTRDIYCYQFR